MRILIVDDEPAALRSVQRILKRHGLRDVESCDNGREAIRRIRDKNFDVVLLDLVMADVDGLQVLEAVKPSRPATELIILTAMDDVPTAVKTIHMGAYDYLVKPVPNERLLLSIERAYERKGLMSRLPGRTSLADEFS